MELITNKTRAKRAAILATIKDRALTTADIAEQTGMHKTTAAGHLNSLLAAGLVRVIKESHSQGLTRFYWIDINAREDAQDDVEDMIARDVKKKLAKIQPHRDWSQFWIPVRQAA